MATKYLSVSVKEFEVLPVHLSSPFSEYPFPQAHPKDPIVLWHTELVTSQLCCPVLHSFMSGNKDLMLNYQTESVLFPFYIY